MLLRICREISARFRFKQTVPDDWLPLKRFFRQILHKTVRAATKADCAVLIAIDGLDELVEDYDAHNLDWLPVTTGPGIRFLITTTAGKAFNAISRRRPVLPIIALSPLTRVESVAICDFNLAVYRKTLTRDQVIDMFAVSVFSFFV